MTDVKEFYKKARRTSTPLVAIQTPDVLATMKALQTTALGIETVEPPVVQWDCVYGVRPRNNEGAAFLDRATPKEPGSRSRSPQPQNGTQALANKTKMLSGCCTVLMDLLRESADDERGIVFLLNPHLHFKEPTGVQALALMRDVAARKGMTVTMLVPDGTKLPREMSLDVAMAVEPVPGDTQLEAMVKRIYERTRTDKGKPLPRLTTERRRNVVGALRGLAAFPAEQALSMALTSTGVSIADVQERKISALEALDGMEIYRGTERFDDLAGVDHLVSFAKDLVPGVELVVLLDEIEKQVGLTREDGGASRAQMGQLLSFMEDYAVDGIMVVGPPGTGKSHLAKAIANESETLCLKINWGQAKNKYVGETEANTARILRAIRGLAPGGGVVFVATSNDVASLPPELLSRFTLGTFMIDLPTPQALHAIWEKRASQYGVLVDSTVDDKDFCGRDVRNACRLAHRLDKPLKSIMDKVVPLARAQHEAIKLLRGLAHDRWLDASKTGIYQNPSGLTSALGQVVEEVESTRSVLTPTGGRKSMN